MSQLLGPCCGVQLGQIFFLVDLKELHSVLQQLADPSDVRGGSEATFRGRPQLTALRAASIVQASALRSC